MNQSELPTSKTAEVGFWCSALWIGLWSLFIASSRGYALLMFKREKLFWFLSALIFCVNLKAVFFSRKRCRNDSKALWGLALSSIPLLIAFVFVVLEIQSG